MVKLYIATRNSNRKYLNINNTIISKMEYNRLYNNKSKLKTERLNYLKVFLLAISLN